MFVMFANISYKYLKNIKSPIIPHALLRPATNSLITEVVGNNNHTDNKSITTYGIPILYTLYHSVFNFQAGQVLLILVYGLFYEETECQRSLFAQEEMS